MSHRRVPSVLSVLGTALAAAAALLLRSAPAAADLKDTIAFDVPAQQLPSALSRYSEQAGVQITSPGQLIEGKTSQGVRGRLEAGVALELLLKDTQLRYDIIDERTVVIMPASAGAEAASLDAQAGHGPLRFAGNGMQESSAEERASPIGQDASPERDGRAGKSSTAGTDLAPSLQEVTVTASRIERSGFRAPTPTTVITAADLQKSGAADIAGYLNELPAFFPTATSTTTTLSSRDRGGNFIDLRGLGPSRTLVLVNGRRHVPTLANGSVDLNAVPSTAVKKIEVVTGGASAAWGSDAVAGVVNVLYDTDLQGVRSDVQLGASQKGDDEEYRVSAAVGDRILDGRGHFMLAAEVHRNFGVAHQSDRDWGRQRWQRIPNPLDTGPGDGQPATITRDHVSLAIASDGGRILGPGPVAGLEFAAGGALVPVQFGSPLGGPYMVGGAGPNMADALTLSVPYQRHNLLGAFQYDLSPDLRFFFEGSYNESESGSPFVPPFAFGVQLEADNAFMPEELRTLLQQDGIPAIAIGRTNTDLGMIRSDRRSHTERAVLGFEGRLADAWSWNVYYQHGATNFRNTQANNRIEANFALAVDAVRDPASGEIVCRAALDLASLPAPLRDAAAACVPLNLFGFGSPSRQAIDYVTGTSSLELRVTQEVVAAQISGDVAQLWAGPLSVALGAESRRERVTADSDSISKADGFMIANPKPLQGSFSVREAFGELALPLLSQQPFASSLELNAAIRRTDYSTIGTVHTSKLGAVWVPHEGILVRGAASRDIRAPNISELFTSRVLSFFSPVDPCDATSQAGDPTVAENCRAAGLPSSFENQASIVPIVSGGNPSLHEEDARVRTAGLVLSPGFAPGFQAAIDWYDIRIRGAINALPPQLLLDQCYGAAIHPAAVCSAIHRGSDGQLEQVDGSLLNIASTRSRGIDAELDYALEAQRVHPSMQGTLRFRLLASHVVEKAFSPDGSTSIDRAGEVGMDEDGVPKWRANFGADYGIGAFEAHAQVRYVGGGKIDVTLDEDDLDRNHIGPQWYLDLSASHARELGAARVELFAGINNVFDRDPPIAPIDFIVSRQTNTGLYDVIGRYFYAGMRLRL